MTQNSITAAALIIAFLIFIIYRGELPYYFGALGLGPMPEKALMAGASSSSGSGVSVNLPPVIVSA